MVETQQNSDNLNQQEDLSARALRAARNIARRTRDLFFDVVAGHPMDQTAEKTREQQRLDQFTRRK